MRNLRTAAALVLLALAFSLAAPAAFGAPRHTSLQARPAQVPSGSVLESLWGLVTRLFSAKVSSTPSVCHFDPLGANGNADAGCRMDPWGNCLPGQ